MIARNLKRNHENRTNFLKLTVALNIMLQQYQRHASGALPWVVYLDRHEYVVLIFVAAENGNLVLVRSMLLRERNNFIKYSEHVPFAVSIVI